MWFLNAFLIKIFVAGFFVVLACKESPSTTKEDTAPIEIDSETDDDTDYESEQNSNTNSITLEEGELEEFNGDPLELSGATLSMNVIQPGALAIATALTEFFGQSTVDGLKSLKYYITDIQLCEDLETNGTGWNNPKNCIMIFSSETANAYDNFGYEEAIAETDAYIDLMNPEDVKKLSRHFKITKRDARSYNYGIINWMQPIKVTAEVTLNDDTIVYTKDGLPVEVTEQGTNDTYVHMVTQVGHITTAPAEEAVVILNNGGSWFKFSDPLVISIEDIETEKKFVVDLTFMPDQLISAYSVMNGDLWGSIDAFPDPLTETDRQNGYGMYVPIISLTPIAHLLDEEITIEEYRFEFRGDNPLDTRPAGAPDAYEEVNLKYYVYFLDNTIIGASGVTVYTENTVSADGIFTPKVFSAELGSNQEILLYDWQEKVTFEDFIRRATVGDSGTARFIASDGTKLDMPYTLISMRNLSD